MISQLLELDMVHYVDLNRNVMPNLLPFTELLKRAEETSKKINAIEQIYDDYSVQLRAPQEIEQMNERIGAILTKSNVAAEKLLQQIDSDIHQQADFLQTQNNLLKQSVMDFRKVLARIFFLENVADLLKIDVSRSQARDVENGMMGEDQQRRNELGDNLLQPQSSAFRIIGGTVRRNEVQLLKKLVFRGTRGKALVNTFDMNLDVNDVLNNKSFTFDTLEGYVIIFDDTTNIGNSIMKICRGFQCDLFETSLSTCNNELMEARQ